MVSLWFLVTFVFQDTGADNSKASNPRIGSTGSTRKHVNYSLATAYGKRTICSLGANESDE